MEASRIIPNAFWRKFIGWAQVEGVKGKFSLLPCPAGLGFIDDRGGGLQRRGAGRVARDLVRTEYMRNFDITPEILTHTLAWDLAKGELLPITEHEWMAQQTEETLADYMAKGLEVLRNVGIVAPGITQPCSFSGDEALYARAVLEAVKRVQRLHPHLLLPQHRRRRPRRRPSPVMIADPARDEFVVSVVSASKADEPFWATIYGDGEIPEMVDYYLTEDGTQGRFRELAEGGRAHRVPRPLHDAVLQRYGEGASPPCRRSCGDAAAPRRPRAVDEDRRLRRGRHWRVAGRKVRGTPDGREPQMNTDERNERPEGGVMWQRRGFVSADSMPSPNPRYTRPHRHNQQTLTPDPSPRGRGDRMNGRRAV